MRSTDERTDSLGGLGEKVEKPKAPEPVVRQISQHVFEVNGKFETRNYPPIPPQKPRR